MANPEILSDPNTGPSIKFLNPDGSTNIPERLSDLTTSGLVDGDWVYLSAIDTVSKTDASAEASAEVIGACEGIDGAIRCAGVINNSKFTTDGGQPVNGRAVYLAPGSADAGTGAGKLSATPSSSPGQILLRIGKCLDNANYIGSKTCKVLFQPSEPILLS